MPQLIAEHGPVPTLRVGVDLVRVADIAASLARFGDRYAARVYTLDERAYCFGDESQAARRLAARFAAKEATLKVLRPAADDGVAWQSIEVRQLAEGACEVQLHGEALSLARRVGIAELSVSMSHEQEYATATVVARLRHPETRPAGRQSQSSWDA
jgi:holo-[acyl-carrier protein] synthase